MRCLMLICSASTIGCVSSSSTESRNVEIISLLLGYKLKNQIYFCIIGTSPLRVFLVFYLHHPFCIPHVLVELCHIFHCRTNLPTVCMCLRPWHSSSMTLQSCTHLRTLRYRYLSVIILNGLQPVFVFDGQPPQLKRDTLFRRRMRKSKVTDTGTFEENNYI